MFRSLHARFLFILILVGILPFVLVGVLLIRQGSQALEEQSSRELMGLARGLSIELDIRLNELLETSRAIASLPDIVSMDAARQEILLKLLFVQFHTYGQLAVADTSGQLQAVGWDASLVSIAHVPSFKMAAQGKQSWVVYPALNSDTLILHMHTPIFNADQEVVGVLGSPVAFPSIAAPLDSLTMGIGRVLILDEDGLVLIHPNPEEAANRRDYSELINLSRSDLTSGWGTATYSIEGEQWLAGYASVPNFGWTIVSERPREEVLLPAVYSRNLAIGGLLGSILLCLLIAHVMARGLTLPVRRLAQAAYALGRGEPDVPLNESRGQSIEIASLIRSFQAMRAAVVEREDSLRQFHSAMEASIDGMAILKEYHIVYANHAMIMLCRQAARDPILEKHWMSLFDQGERERIEADVYALLRLQGKWRGEATIRHKDGRKTYLDISLTQLESGEAILVVRDLAERKQAEAALIQAQKMKSLGLLAGGIAHDFNNLIAAMLGQSFVIRKKISQENSAHENIARIIKSGERAADLTRQLLAYAGKGSSLVTIFDINNLIQENVDILQTAVSSNVQLILDLAPDSLEIEADKGQIQQIIMNLVINSAEAIGSRNGMVRIRTMRYTALDEPTFPADTAAANHVFTERELKDGNSLSLEIFDTGAGMVQETLDRIFDPFFTTKNSGSGLGLSATLGIMQSLKGSVHVRSMQGMGSMFRLIFPAVHKKQKNVITLPVLKQDPLSGTALIADDELPMREAMQDILESCGMDVLVASNGREAVELFRHHRKRISLTLLDLRMPVMNGIDALRSIKRLDNEARIVLMSGYTESEVAESLLDKKTVFFMPKPYSYEQLITHVENLSRCTKMESV